MASPVKLFGNLMFQNNFTIFTGIISILLVFETMIVIAAQFYYASLYHPLPSNRRFATARRLWAISVSFFLQILSRNYWHFFNYVILFFIIRGGSKTSVFEQAHKTFFKEYRNEKTIVRICTSPVKIIAPVCPKRNPSFI